MSVSKTPLERRRFRPKQGERKHMGSQKGEGKAGEVYSAKEERPTETDDDADETSGTKTKGFTNVPVGHMWVPPPPGTDPLGGVP